MIKSYFVNVFSGPCHVIDFMEILNHGNKCRYLYSSGPPADGLYFTLNGALYCPNETVFIEDIGSIVADRNERGAALVCHTDNVNTECCRSADNNHKGPIGDWFYPNNSKVTHNSQDTTDNTFVRIGFEREVRLVTRGSPTRPVGLYTCRVPDSRGETVSASIFIVSSELTT